MNSGSRLRGVVGSAFWICIVCASTLAGCGARPAWTTRLPDPGETAANPSIAPKELGGVWIRQVDSRYGVGNPRAHSVGREALAIASGGTRGASSALYTKIHLYREQVGRDVTTRGYREFGTLETRGPYLLFRPDRAEALAPERTTAPPEQAPVDISLPSVQSPAIAALPWQSTGAPGALLFFFEAERREASPHYADDRVIPARLTPLAYEAFGVVYDYGIFEGTRAAYDFESRNFRDALAIWNGKRNQPHAYVRVLDAADDR